MLASKSHQKKKSKGCISFFKAYHQNHAVTNIIRSRLQAKGFLILLPHLLVPQEPTKQDWLASGLPHEPWSTGAWLSWGCGGACRGHLFVGCVDLWMYMCTWEQVHNMIYLCLNSRLSISCSALVISWLLSFLRCSVYCRRIIHETNPLNFQAKSWLFFLNK